MTVDATTPAPAAAPAPAPAAAAARPAPRGLERLLTPKVLFSVLITLILVAGERYFGALGGYHRLALALACCMATEALLSWLMLGRRPFLLSSYVSGNSLALLLKPLETVIWPFVVGAMLAISSKYVLRYRGRHLWNPTNFAITALVVLAPAEVSILSHEFGNAWQVNAVIWAIGLIVVSRAKLLHVTLTYAVSFLVLAAIRAPIVGTSVLTEAAPITGPMYQLFVFFMITDPPTTVSTWRGRVLVAVLIALAEMGIRLGIDFDVAFLQPLAPIAPLAALAVVGPVAKAIDLRRKAA